MNKVFKLAELIYEIGLMAHRSHDVESTLRSISERILQETGAFLAGIELVEEDCRESVLTVGVMSTGEVLPSGFRQPLDTGVVGRVIRTGQLICLENIADSEDYEDLIPGMQSELAVPLFFGGKVIGALNIESDRPGQFGKAEIALLQAIANPIALAIENARLYQKEQKRLAQMTMLNQLNQVLTSTIEANILLNRVVETIRSQLGYDFVAIGLVNESDRVILKSFSSTVPVKIPMEHSQAMGEGVTGEVILTGKSLLVPHVKKHKNFISIHSDFKSEMCCPLRVGERIFGCLDAEDRRPDAFDKNDLLVFETVADHIAQAVENAENLQRVNQLREELARMIVHDLRNPITVVHSALEMLDSRDIQLPEVKKTQYLKTAKASCDELLVLLDSLLELEKIENGKLELQREKLKPLDLIHPVVESLKIKAEIANKSLTFTVHDQMLIIEVDRRLFSRVLQNLVINALKYTKRGGHIHITSKAAPKPIVRRYLKARETGLLLSVQDDGPGIPPGEEENIFNKFTTLKPHSTEIERGTGLGLTFCREVTHAHEGKIWVDSKFGRGSTFNVLLPLN